MIKFSNDFKWLLRIAVGITLGLYIFYITKPIVADKLGVYQTENMANEVKIAELQQQLNNVKSSNSSFSKKTHELNQKIADLKKQNERLQKSTITELQAAKPAGVPDTNHALIDKLNQRLNAPAFVQIYNHSTDLSTCSMPAKQTLFSWLQFLMLYSDLELRTGPRDTATLQEGLFQNADKMRKIAKSEGFLFWPIINQLVLYHDKIQTKSDWQQDFDAILKNNHPLGELISRFYEHGYPQSKHACFTQPLAISATDGLGHTWAGSRITLDEWFYSFWLRRYKEKTHDVTYVALKMLQMLTTNDANNQLEHLALVSNGVYDMARKNIDPQTLDAYQNVIYGLLSKESKTITIPVDKKIETDLVTKLYPLLENEGGVTYSYTGIDQSYLKDELSPTFWLQYRRSVDGKTGSSFVSVKPPNGVNMFYKKTDMDASNRLQVLSVVENRYGRLWAGNATAQSAKYCNNRPSTSIQKRVNGSDSVYIVNAACSYWGGDGTVGFYFSALLKQKSGGGIEIVWANRGMDGVMTVSGSYVADLDRDGDLEVIANIAAGLSSSDQLVEISKDGMFLVKPLAEYSEGGYESYSGLQQNRMLLSKGLK